MKRSKWPLFITFALTVITGLICYFIKDSESAHHQWVVCQVIHILASVAFVIYTIIHIKPFTKWYTKWKTPIFKYKSLITFMASLLCLLLIVTGIALLLFIEGGDSPVGLVHFYIGLAFIVFCGWHCIKRWWLKPKIKPTSV